MISRCGTYVVFRVEIRSIEQHCRPPLGGTASNSDQHSPR
jgi:hypothetical protein